MVLDQKRRAAGRWRAFERLAIFFGCSLLMTAVAPAAWAQNATPEEEYKKLIKVNEDIQPLGDTPFGERIGLYDGSLSFSQTDVSVSGTGPTITVGREFTLHGLEDRPDLQNRAFGDWDIALPQIFSVTANQHNVTSWQVDAANRNAICSGFNEPPSVAAPVGDSKRADWEPATWWQGYQLRIPGQGSQDLLRRSPTNTVTPGVGGLAYPIVTRSQWAIGCLPQASNDPTVEGFLAVAPDGTKYWLDHIAYRYMPSLTRPLGSSPVSRVAGGPVIRATNEDILIRREGRMLVTRIEDRFGNAISYTYNGDLVTDITASDGRHVSLTYEDGTPRVSSVTVQAATAGTRTWSYSYVKSAQNLVYTLTSVTQPDGSRWGYNLDPLNHAWVDMRTAGGSCAAIGVLNDPKPHTATVTHPSGLTASYTVVALKRGRSYVPQTCSAGPGLPETPNGVGTWAQIPNASYSMAITQRVLTGAGLGDGLKWNYSYSPSNESWLKDCTAGCLAAVYTDVIYPDGHAERSTFSNRYDWTESQLLAEDVYDGAVGTALRQATRYSYVNPDVAQDARAAAYPHPWGYVFQERVNQAQLKDQLPMATRTVILEPGNAAPDSFTWNATAFDGMARATDVQRSSSVGYGVTERTTFADDAAHWVIGLPAQSDNLTTGETISRNVYDPATMTLSERYRFGRKVMGYTFDSQGQLASFTDGRSHTTTLSNYKLGIPRTIGYADGTGQSVAVDDMGQIASITNQAGDTTSYGYDAIGRVARIDYPGGDTVAWAPKIFSYSYVADVLGVGGDHWMRLESQGNWSQRTDYDALLRPVFNGKAESGTGYLYVSSRTDYDWKGRKTFQSYPYNGQQNLSTMDHGMRTRYDVLGRVVGSVQASEQGDLTTTTQYATGAAQIVTDPKGNATTTWFQVFDTPAYDKPVHVDAPEGITQIVTRDVFGNPLSIAQGGVTKTMTYDSEHRLCRSWEPESGSEITAYDEADNVAWSASGQPFNGAGCGYDQVADAAKTVRGYDALNRLTAASYPNGSLGTSYTYDAVGNIATAVSSTASGSSNSTGTVAWRYGRNRLGLLTMEELSVDNHVWALQYGYDGNGNLSTLQYPDSEVVAYNPNALGQPTTAGRFLSGATYFPDGDLESYAMASGALYVAEKNDRDLVKGFSYGTGAAPAVAESLSYDAAGNITAIGDPLGQRSRTMAYDGLNRLTSATASGLWQTESYTYDTLNNIRSMSDSGGTRTYNYDGNNLLSSISNNGATVHAFQYDARGNTVVKDGQTMNFDLANRLLSIAGKGDYMYDAAGRRVKTSAPGAITYYAYNSAGQLMWQYDANTADGTDYIHLGKKLIASKKATTSVIVGNIDDVTTGADAAIRGWACSKGLSQPIALHVYVGGAAGTGTFMTDGSAGQDSEPAVQDACAAGGQHRFSLPITEEMRVKFVGKTIYVHGISPVGGENLTIANSGNFVVPASILAPQPSASVTVAAASDLSTLTVNWAASAKVTSYALERSWNGEPWPAVYNGTDTSLTLPVAVDGSYVFRVKACNANGCSNPTMSNTVTVAHIPATPGGINVPSTSTGSVPVSWGAASYATSYQLEHTLDGNWTAVWTGGDLSTTVGESASGNWYYRVKACDANGCGPYATSGYVTVTVPPASAPSVAGGGTSTNGNYLIGWSDVAGASYYNVSENANGAGWIVQGSVANAGSGFPVSGKGDGTYRYSVQACNAGGCGPWGNEVSVTVTLIPATPARPSISTSNPPTKPIVQVTWAAVAGATRYEVLQTNQSNYSDTVYNGSSPVWKQLVYYTGQLSYTVRACNAVGCSAYSTAVSIYLNSAVGSNGGL